MAMNQGNQIQTSSIIEKFTNDVKNTILSGAYHAGNIPYCQGYQCVPTAMLGNVDSIQSPEGVGTAGNKITASQVYTALIDVTTALTRVGSFSFVRRIQYRDQYGSSGYRITGQLSGKALFSDEYIKTLNPVEHNDLDASKPVTVKVINDLIAACLTAWQGTVRHNYTYTDDYCHENCHSNCHYNCHSNCHHICYMNGSCYENPGCWDHKCYTYPGRPPA